MNASPAAAARGTGVDVYYCPTGTLDESAADDAAALLSDDERRRCASFGRAADRRDYAVAHALLRLMVGARTGIAPAAVRFGADRYGKPFVAAGAGRAAPPQFSLSRGRGVIAVALVHRGWVGVDVEPIDARTDAAAVARHAFSAEESASIEQLPPPARAARFYELWTLREALFKAVGFGLAAPPSCASFDLRQGQISLRAGAPLPCEAWTCAVRHISGTHVLAVAVSRLNEARRPVSIAEVRAGVFRHAAGGGGASCFSNGEDASMLPEVHPPEA